MRKANGILQFRGPNDQVIPTFAGWLLKHRQNDVVTKTVVMYLPPISSKVTDFSTIFKYLSRLQKLSADVNMPYMNVILDIGAAMNAYKMIWNYPHKFPNCVVHPGDFHAMKENYCVIGNIVAASGFEDVVFQSGLGTSGSVQGILSGTHYNRAWVIHSAVSEAMERPLKQKLVFHRQ